MAMAMAIGTAASSLLHSKPLPPPPAATFLSHSPQLAQQLHLPKTTPSRLTPLVLITSSSTLQKTLPTTSRSNSPKISFLSSLTATAVDTVAMVCPSLAYANTLCFKSGFNVQINVKENESEESILFRFKKAAIRARILQECKRRRFFENTQDKKTRKSREAARRNSKRRQQPRAPVKHEAPKKKNVDDDDDNWELPEGEIPYCY